MRKTALALSIAILCPCTAWMPAVQRAALLPKMALSRAERRSLRNKPMFQNN